jgi:ABC-type oligopeptide transport system ATPase subunit
MAVNGVDFFIKKGETVGLVGESGSGKTTVGRCIVRLYEPTEGSVEFNINGNMIDLPKVPKKGMKSIRKHFQMLFQDVYSSLNSRMKVGDIVTEPMAIHNVGSKKERIDRRIGITRALSINPDFIICDEPVSALDVSVQAQILNLLLDLQDEFQLSYLFIAHDLGVVKYISDRVMVMYLGKIFEIAYSKDIYENPRHPYTEALLASISK